MSWIARRIARDLWAAMLWLIRRRWVRRLQRAGLARFREGSSRDRARQSFLRQERFARRYGLKTLTVIVTVCLYTLAFLLIYNFLGFCIEQGWLPVRESDSSPQ